MAERHPNREREPMDEIDDASIAQLRRDPDVTVYRRTTDEPFVSNLSVTEPVDPLWMLGRGYTVDEVSVTSIGNPDVGR